MKNPRIIFFSILILPFSIIHAFNSEGSYHSHSEHFDSNNQIISSIGNSADTIYRIQLDVYETIQPKETYASHSDVIYLKEMDGLFHYYKGCYYSKNEAEKALDVCDINCGINTKIVSFRVEHTFNRDNPKLNDKEWKYKIQLGAFNTTRVPSTFPNIEEYLIARESDSLVHYYSGDFSDPYAALEHQKELKNKGCEHAFIAIFKDDRRVNLPYRITAYSYHEGISIFATSNYNVRYCIKIGEFEDFMPMETLNEYLLMGNVQFEKLENGNTLYYIGNYGTFEEAESARKKLSKKNLDDCCVIASYKGRFIPVTNGGI